MRKRVVISCLLIFVVAFAVFGGGQREEEAFPSRPIRIIVPFGVGGSSGAMIETIRGPLEEELGVPVNVEYMPGASSAMGLAELQASPNDGYTIGTTTSMIFGAYHNTRGQIDYRSFEHIANTTEEFLPITVHRDSPWQTLPQLLDHIRANPGRVRFGNSGVGGSSHVSTILLEQAFGVEVLHVPFNTGNQAAVGILGQHVEAVCLPLGDMIAILPTGGLRILAMGSPERNPFYPNIPTIQEATGVPLNFVNFRGFLAPNGTPEYRLRIISAAIGRAMQRPAFIEFFEANALTLDYEDGVTFERKFYQYADQIIPILRSIE